MPRPIRPFAGRWSLVAAVLLPCGDSEPAPDPSSTISRETPPSPVQPSLTDEDAVPTES